MLKGNYLGTAWKCLRSLNELMNLVDEFGALHYHRSHWTNIKLCIHETMSLRIIIILFVVEFVQTFVRRFPRSLPGAMEFNVLFLDCFASFFFFVVLFSSLAQPSSCRRSVWLTLAVHQHIINHFALSISLFVPTCSGKLASPGLACPA